MVVSPGAYFDHILGCWEAAAARVRSTEQFYRIAGCSVRMLYAGDALLPVMAAPFAHLKSKEAVANPDLTIRLFDSAASGIKLPNPPAGFTRFTARGELEGFHDGRYYAAFQPFGRILNVFDSQRREAVVCVSDSGKIASYELAVPLRTIFGWFMPMHGRQLVHAASVGTKAGGVLIIGDSGAGKSNTAIGSLSAGLDFVSDDFCAVSSDPVPEVHSLYGTCRIRRGDWAVLPFERSNTTEPQHEKNLYYLHAHFPGRISPGYPLVAILLPHKGGTGAPRLEPMSSSLAVARLASQSSAMLPDAGEEVLQRLTRLSRKVPTHRLHLGDRPSEIPILIRTLIEAGVPARRASAS